MITTRQTPTNTDRALFEAIDSGDLVTIGALIADDVHFRFGNAEPTQTKADFTKTAQAFFSSIAGIRHEVSDLWVVGEGAVVAVMDVHYTTLDGRS
jgi:ketosteroid isomerase-like protein